MIELDTIFNEDCLKGMERIPDGSVDAVICDLPYGTTVCKWDVIIPFESLWEQYRRVCKPSAAIVLFGQEPFSSKLRMSNPQWFRYDWYWKKTRFANYAQAPYMPIKDIEIISVFSKGTIAANSANKMNYFPQGLKECHIEVKNKPCSNNFRPNRKPQTYTRTHQGYPHQLLLFPNGGKVEHPTQKPVELIRYLIRTYTNSGGG